MLTETGTARATPADQLATILRKKLPEITNRLEIVPNADEAVEHLLRDDTRPGLVAGSLFLAGIALARIRNLQYQASLQ